MTWRAVSLAAVLATGCGPRHAGFGDVQQLVKERTNRDVSWSYVEEDREDAAKALLAKPLTADSAVQIALLRNRDLQAAFEELGIARAMLLDAVRPQNPFVEGDVQFERDGSGTRHLELAVLQSVSDLIYAGVRGSIASDRLEGAKLSAARAVLDLGFEARSAFYGQQAAEQIFEMRRTIAEAARAGYELAKRLHDAGNISDLDFDIERGLYEDARIQLGRAEQALVESRERLNAVLGLFGPETDWRVAGRLPDPPVEEIVIDALEKKVIEASLEIASLKSRIDAQASQVGLEQAQGIVPNVALGVEVEGELGGEAPLPIGPVFGVTLPLWDQGQGRVAMAESELRRLKETHAARAVRLRAEARATRARAESTRQRAIHFKTVVLPLRQRILEQTELMQNAMQVGLFQLLVAKRDQIEAGREYVETLADYWRARAELDLLLAGGSPTGWGGNEMSGGENAPRRREEH